MYYLLQLKKYWKLQDDLKRLEFLIADAYIFGLIGYNESRDKWFKCRSRQIDNNTDIHNILNEMGECYGF